MGPLNPVEVTSVKGRRACNNEGRCKDNAAHLSLHLCDQKEPSAIRAEITDI